MSTQKRRDLRKSQLCEIFGVIRDAQDLTGLLKTHMLQAAKLKKMRFYVQHCNGCGLAACRSVKEYRLAE